MIVAPAVQMVDSELVSRFDDFAAAGGSLILTCRTALMDRNGQLWEGPLAQPILHLIGGSISQYDVLPDDSLGTASFSGKTYKWNIWGDQLKPNPGTEVLATYADQFYKGAPAITRHRYKKGTVSYCGVFGQNEIAEALVEMTAKDCGTLGSNAWVQIACAATRSVQGGTQLPGCGRAGPRTGWGEVCCRQSNDGTGGSCSVGGISN